MKKTNIDWLKKFEDYSKSRLSHLSYSPLQSTNPEKNDFYV
ncbi:hypothetical protein LEP1GSC043_1593 [Leptospira weilii str. Ecochallenge]|uniref:Uncharacterized protein n=1 Tax=Leptospira weilii str. Ecochallenge TaxID=1049986 RepID=N1U3G5_9LEPT|nr:hypothetical protein LEP1GSC043_1593 [Leptospira weilii str. Ecochallenge]